MKKELLLTPEILKKYKSLGLDYYLSKNYASHLGIKDEEYKVSGANFFKVMMK